MGLAQRAGGTRLGVLAIGRVFSPLQRWLYRTTGGRISLTGGAPVLLLTTTGRRTGLERTVPLLYVCDGGRLVICNVNPGFERPNPWTLNLRALPRAQVQVGHEIFAVTAREASEEESGHYWPRLTAVWPAYQTFYDRGGGRSIFVLEPTTAAPLDGPASTKQVRSESPRDFQGMNARFERWMYPGSRPNRLARLLNRGWAVAHAAGLWPSRLVTLEVPGRRTGRLISFPLVMTDYEGQRYLVSMLGEKSNWVRNVRAADGRAVLRHGRREDVRLEEIEPQLRAPILRRYLSLAPGPRAFIRVDRDAPLAEFEKIAPHIPVFHVTAERPTDRPVG